MVVSSSPRGRPAGINSNETRRRIIDAAMRCVAESGCAGAGIREIAAAAEITSGSLYHHFPSKAELLQATVAAAREAALPRLRIAARRHSDVVAQLAAVLEEADRMAQENPQLAAFDRAMGTVPPLRDVIGEIVSDAQRGGALAAGVEPDSAADAVYALARGLAEQADRLPPAAYRDALRGAEDLIRGALF
ncbi:TetR family transcriptional regulator [Mycolicibacter heraklionensis]|uniref:TetR family transcriptional regulator n=1 Tax=Mycolicibacter heraklionensis TaxID=512402 RepID=A0ABR5FGE7_9MYCO|nr:TetR/AcrR family transcriptional regulator [Mycolicibacter heraklionensis]KLO29405.1 TetR family transcriptional regulator [Mycolicibacter heraklionensis]